MSSNKTSGVFDRPDFDPTPVVFRKKTPSTKKSTSSIPKSVSDDKPVEKKTLDQETKKEIIRRRVELDLKQKDLSAKTGVPVKDIASLEKGELIPDALLQKVLKFLGLSGRKTVKKETKPKE